jgi:hypothetical protein
MLGVGGERELILGGRLERTLFISYSIHPFSGYEVSHDGLTTTNLKVLNFELSSRVYTLS